MNKLSKELSKKSSEEPGLRKMQKKLENFMETNGVRLSPSLIKILKQFRVQAS